MNEGGIKLANKVETLIQEAGGAKVNQNLKRVIKGSIFAIVISLIAVFIYAIILTYTNVSENTMIPVIIVIAGISILIGSYISNLKIKKQGMLNGALVGLIYMLFIYITSSIALTGFNLNMNSIIMILVGMITGIIGGIIGVNLS